MCIGKLPLSPLALGVFGTACNAVEVIFACHSRDEWKLTLGRVYGLVLRLLLFPRSRLSFNRRDVSSSIGELLLLLRPLRGALVLRRAVSNRSGFSAMEPSTARSHMRRYRVFDAGFQEVTQPKSAGSPSSAMQTR